MVLPRRYPTRPIDLTPQILLGAYMQGAFPMARSRTDPRIEWINPDPRAVLPLNGFRTTRNLRQIVRSNTFEIRHDTAFDQVIRACAQPRKDHEDTWINDDIIRVYSELFEMGFVHSIEAWREEELVGGLYGIGLGGMFCGESMFHKPELGGNNASKVCLVHLVQHLKKRGFQLLDVQINSEHMRKFGTIDISRRHYLRRLEEAIRLSVKW